MSDRKKRGPHYREGQILKTHAQLKGLSPTAVAEALEIPSVTTIFNIHNGFSWNLANVYRYRELLELPEDIFEQGAPEERPDAEKKSAAVELFMDFPDDVQQGIVIYGQWLTDNYRGKNERLRELTRSMSELMSRNKPNE